MKYIIASPKSFPKERTLKPSFFLSSCLKETMLGFILLFFYAQYVSAQSDRGNEGTISKEVTVVKPYEPVINDAFKIGVSPQFHDSIQATKEFGYTIMPKIANTGFNPEPIEAVKLKGELLNKLYRTQVKLGIGTYNTPYAEVFVNTLRSTKYLAGAHARHWSSFGTINEVGNSAYSENGLSVYGKKFLKEAVLSADIKYDRNSIHYYGFSTSDTIIDKKDIRQTYNYIEGKAAYYTTHNDENKLAYRSGFKAYYLSDAYKSSENNFQLSANLGRTLKTQRIEGSSNINYNHFISTTDTFNEFTLSVSPQIVTKNDNLFFSVGITPCLDVDTSAHMYFYPNVDATYKLVGDFVSIYATAKGGLKQNTFKTITDENPFVVSSPFIRATNEKVKVSLGSKGLIGLYIPYDVYVSYGMIDNMPFYITDTNEIVGNKFNLVYDTVQLLQIHVQAAYQKLEKLKILLKTDYYHYQLKTEQHPWHKPTFTVSLSGEYLLQDKIIAKADIIALNSFYAKTYDNAGIIVPVKLKGIVDINLGAEYRYTERLSAFVTINNLLSSRYQRWYNYPNQRILLMGGVSFSF